LEIPVAMNILNREIKRAVFVTTKADKYITVPSNCEYSVTVEDDLKKEINNLVLHSDNDTIYAILFIHISEYQELYNFLTSFAFVDISYRFFMFGDESDIVDFDFNYFHNISEFRSSPISEIEFGFITHKTFLMIEEIFVNKFMQEDYLARLIDTKEDQEDLIGIGKALILEKDQDSLLRLILTLSKKITGADAGSIYLVEEDEAGKKRLRFKYSHTFSREIPLEEFVIEMNKKSIAGYVAVTGEVLNITDVYKLPPEAPYGFNSSFDEQNNYICRSMLVVPMRNHVDEIIGVIQLINSKEDLSKKTDSGDEAFTIRLEKDSDFNAFVVSFDEKYDSLMEAVAGQAAVAIENNRMIQQIQHQFEEFVKASVTAIESRDPATSGHSFRVAAICKEMAYAVNEEKDGYLKDYYYNENDIRELEYAALLHDFGKVYIDLAVFKKAKKLYPKDYENLSLRLDYLYRFLELQYTEKETHLLQDQDKSDNGTALDNLLKERNDKLNRITEIREKLLSMNEPAVINEDSEAVLNQICNEIEEIECKGIDGASIKVISDLDKMNLKITKGSLNQEERKEIESHVVHTYRFVSKIPWPPEYKRIPEIALSHHEKLDGTGYPDGLKGRESTLLQSRMMAIADIYDALVASDRPYKKALPLEKVLSILKEEAERGILDGDLVNVFIERKIYEKVDKDSFRFNGQNVH
jgi:HD-GYP domain-containing protein (c-di-GMP phosphodiesterase class II)